MKKYGILACVASFVASVASGVSNAQCSASSNLASIAALNENSLVVDHVIGDYELIFYANEEGEAVVFYLDDSGAHYASGYTEEADGSILIEDDGILCLVACNTSGGVLISMMTDSIDPMTVAVTSSGSATTASTPNVCPCLGNGTRSRVYCTNAACDANAPCKRTSGVNSAWCTWPNSGGGSGGV